MDCSNGILDNTISYLYKISEALPSNLTIPKSYYASKSRILELKGNTALPTKLTAGNVRCPRCCLKFADYPPIVRLRSKRQPDRFTKKILKKIEKGQYLTSFQQNYKNLMSKMSDKHTLIKMCQFCQKEIKTDLSLKIKDSKKKVDVNISEVIQKRKKKRKDKFAGLIPSAVIVLDETPQKKTVTEILNENKLKQKENNNKKMLGNFNKKKCVIGSKNQNEQIITGINEGKKKKKKKSKKIVEPLIVKSTKMKIVEKKERKANQERKNKIQNLLNGLNKPKASNILNGFLETL